MDNKTRVTNVYVNCVGECKGSNKQLDSPCYTKNSDENQLGLFNVKNTMVPSGGSGNNNNDNVICEIGIEETAGAESTENDPVKPNEGQSSTGVDNRNQSDPVSKKKDPNGVLYGITERPSWYMCLILGFQHYIVMFGAAVSTILIMSSAMCIGENDVTALPQIIGTNFFCCGIVTFLQSIVGVRLPIVQGGSFTYIAPVIAIFESSRWNCSITEIYGSMNKGLPQNMTLDDVAVEDGLFEPRPWKVRMLEIQGAILIGSLVEMAIGFSGLLGFILQWMGPLVVTPTVTLIGLDLFGVATQLASKQWWMALLTVLLIAMFSQYTRNIKLPLCHYSKVTGCTLATVPLFLMLPVILSIAITWIIYIILLETGLLTEDVTNDNFTHLRISTLENAPWFRVPYPGQWGVPTFTVTSIIGILAGVLASIVESIGDYYACARMSAVRPPPLHAINRGIGVEGIGTFIFAIFGCGTGTTSYSENIGSVGVNKVASRRVIQCAALVMVIFGVFPKFGALFVQIPESVIGGVFIVMFGMVAGIGISNLQFVDMDSSRNLFIIGFSFYFGLTIPEYARKEGSIDTGNASVDQSLRMLLGTGMLVGGLSAFVLDNTIPGTDKERGIKNCKKHKKPSKKGAEDYYNVNVYDVPLISRFIKDKSWARFVPFLPTFDETIMKIRKHTTSPRQ